MAPLRENIDADLKQAMRARDQRRVNALRLMIAAMKQKEIDERIVLDESQVLVILNKLAKQRKESIQQYQKAQREDLVAQEVFELDIIQTYLPQPFSDEEVLISIMSTIEEIGAQSIKDMGKVMASLTKKMQGRADMSKVSSLVKEKLN